MFNWDTSNSRLVNIAYNFYKEITLKVVRAKAKDEEVYLSQISKSLTSVYGDRLLSKETRRDLSLFTFDEMVEYYKRNQKLSLKAQLNL